jgi:ABC-type proline/glycine betaine transport system ATPase subunit
MKEDLLNELRMILHKTKIPAIYVTHDQTEAMTMGDRIVVVKDGLIQQIADPISLYDKPRNKFVASFIELFGRSLQIYVVVLMVGISNSMFSGFFFIDLLVRTSLTILMLMSDVLVKKILITQNYLTRKQNLDARIL